MNNLERYKKSKIILDEAYDKNDIYLVLAHKRILYDNNDFVEYPFCTSYGWALDYHRNFWDIDYQDFLDSCGDFIDQDDVYFYNCIISKTIHFLDNNIKMDNISRYTFLQSLFKNNIFSGSYKKDSPYVDNHHVMGIDVILGNSCCRHKESLMHDVLKKYTDVLNISVGFKENESSSHVILGIKENAKWLYLDSTTPHIFFPISDNCLNVYGYNKGTDIYIKPFMSYVKEQYFKNPLEYYIFFNKLYTRSALSIEEYIDLLYEIQKNYKKYNNDLKLLKDFEIFIKQEREALQLIYRRK